MTERAIDFSLLRDPALRPDPYPVLAELRAASPVTMMDGALVVVARHEQCDRVLREPTISSDRATSRLGDGPAPRIRSFLFLDPPDHTRLRRLVTKAFTPRVVAGLVPRIETITDELLTAAAERGRLDVVADLAYPLPVRIISELLGVPDADRDLMLSWSAPLALSLEPDFLAAGQGGDTAAEQARAQFLEYFADLIRRRRAHPADDLVSYLVGVEDGGDRLSELDLLATCVLLLVAGHETTANLIANGVLALLRHPDQLAALRADPALADAAVEEILRYDPPVQLTTRVARAPLALGDTTVQPESVLLLLLGAANRDPGVFADPDRFDIRRPPGRHLAFAAGPHFCLGAGLARAEGAVALRAFATRLAAPRLDEDGLVYKPNINLRGPARLPVAFAGYRRQIPLGAQTN